jgi:hypothetical protein
MAQAQRRAEAETFRVGDSIVKISRNQIEIFSQQQTLTLTFGTELPEFRRRLERAQTVQVGRTVPRRAPASTADQSYQSALFNLERVCSARRNNTLLGEQRVPELNRLLTHYEQLQAELQRHPERADALNSQFRERYGRQVEELFRDYSLARTFERPNRLMLIRNER